VDNHFALGRAGYCHAAGVGAGAFLLVRDVCFGLHRVTTMPVWEQLLGLADAELRGLDIAETNLACAAGLPGAEALDVRVCLETLERWATLVRRETAALAWQFEASPAAFENSWANFRILIMVTVLQRNIGVRYNPTLIDRADFFRDAKNLFLHGVIASKVGTCSSLPPLYAAIGRRLGYPLRLVSTRCHLFARWDDSGRERFNIECTSRGLNCYPVDHYRDWPVPLTEGEVESATFLRSKSPREELAEFLAARGHCCLDNGLHRQAVTAYAWASRLDPDNYLRRLSVQDALDRWDRRLHQLSPPDLSSRTVFSPPTKLLATPPDLGQGIVPRQTLQDLLTDAAHDRDGWEPTRRSPGRDPAAVPSPVLVRHHQATGAGACPYRRS
jgi:hypothetical protein